MRTWLILVITAVVFVSTVWLLPEAHTDIRTPAVPVTVGSCVSDLNTITITPTPSRLACADF